MPLAAAARERQERLQELQDHYRMRLHALMAAAERAIEGLAVPGLASLSFMRARVARDPAGPWAGFVDYRARLIG